MPKLTKIHDFVFRISKLTSTSAIPVAKAAEICNSANLRTLDAVNAMPYLGLAQSIIGLSSNFIPGSNQPLLNKIVTSIPDAQLLYFSAQALQTGNMISLFSSMAFNSAISIIANLDRVSNHQEIINDPRMVKFHESEKKARNAAIEMALSDALSCAGWICLAIGNPVGVYLLAAASIVQLHKLYVDYAPGFSQTFFGKKPSDNSSTPNDNLTNGNPALSTGK